MGYQLDFGVLAEYFSLLLHGVEITLGLTAISATLGLAFSIGGAATARWGGQREAGLALGIQPATVFFWIVLPQAVANVYPALVSQIVITMLESAVVSQIAVTDLTHVADFIQSRTYRAFETYFAITLVYLAMSVCLRWLFTRAGRRLFAGRAR
jgi:polar amino acid transport system permease protein